jgi:hypothetical protein
MPGTRPGTTAQEIAGSAKAPDPTWQGGLDLPALSYALKASAAVLVFAAIVCLFQNRWRRRSRSLRRRKRRKPVSFR